MKSRMLVCLVVILSFHLAGPPAQAQGSTFTYQGRLNDGAGPVSGVFDLQFTLYGSAAGLGETAEPITTEAIPVSKGLFTVNLEFGEGVFTGDDHWLEIGVRSNGAGPFTILAPRQQITATPYAVHAANANASGLVGTIPSSSLSGSYTEPIVLDNPANSLVGTFTGDGSGLIGVNTATSATTAETANNVALPGTVTTSEVLQYVDPAIHTNAIARLAYGALNLPTMLFGQTATGTANFRNGVQFWPTGWNGENYEPLNNGALPMAFMQTLMGWGGYRYDNPTLHLMSRGDIRIEPAFSSVENYGYSYVSIGNEDGNSKQIINYSLPSIRDAGGTGGFSANVRGYGLPLSFPTYSRSNSTTMGHLPAIGSVSAPVGALPGPSGSIPGELWFYRRGPEADFGTPTFNTEHPDYQQVGGKMTYDGWEFYSGKGSGVVATNLKTDIISAPGGYGDSIYVQGNLNIGLPTSKYRIVDSSLVIKPIGPYQQFILTHNNGYHGLGIGTYAGGTKVGDFIMSDQHIVLVEGTASAVRADFDLQYNTNTISGFTVFTNGYGQVRANVVLTADNQVVGAATNALLLISSDQSVAATRTFVLTTGIDGKILRIAWSGTNAGELLDDAPNFGSGNLRLNGNWTPTQYDVLTLVGVGTDWYEVSRSAN